MKAVHMTLFWNLYVSFAIVSHYCFSQGIYTTFIPQFKKEWVSHKPRFL